MTAYLVLPSDLTPTALTCLDCFPPIVSTIVEECLAHQKCGDTERAIQCARQAQELTEVQNHPVSTSIILLLLADLYRELDQIGLALTHCQKACDTLRLQPDYEHRHHAQAVIVYLQGLLHHALGANTEALSYYQQALTSFENALKHWNSDIVRNPAHAEEYRERADKCEKVCKWIEVLYRFLLWPTRCCTEMHIPAAKGQGYDLVRLEMLTCLTPQGVVINGHRYRLHHPSNGFAYSDDERLTLDWNTHHFAVRVPEDQWAGPYSTEGDYVLVKREQKTDTLTGAGVLRSRDQEQWEYGTFSRDAVTGEITFNPLKRIVIGGEKIHDQEIGSVRALLKPV